MQTVEKIIEIKMYLEARKQTGSIGFVPTMGALHEGHLSLVRRSKNENDTTVVSIFVNPAQFNEKSDLEKYPRSVEADIEQLNATGCDAVFIPSGNEMYPPGESLARYQFNFGRLDAVLEGKFRKNHFRGVAIVVSKLFDIVQPDSAYFGEKDYQQLLIIRKLVEIENRPIKIVPCPIVREDDGLAMSSRNQRLTAIQRQHAPFLFQTLCKARKRIPSLSVQEVKKWAKAQFELNTKFELDYFEIADAETLQPAMDWGQGKKTMGLAAAFLGGVRLIDNMVLFP